MTFTLDPISLTNLILSIIILALGIMGYKNSDDKAPLFIGIAFGLFGVSHLMALLGLKETLTVLLDSNENHRLCYGRRHLVLDSL